jgi:hypothetical protein
MTESIVWVSPDQVINLGAVAHIKFGGGIARVVFNNAETITLDEKPAEALAKYMRGAFIDLRTR